MRIILFILFAFNSVVYSQSRKGFWFGSVSQEDLSLTTYPNDTSAVAVVLNEFGETYMSNTDNNPIVLDYHVRIKILKPGGFNLANYVIPVRVGESVTEIQASTFNLEGGAIKETKVEKNNILTDQLDKHFTLKKFPFPNVHVGSIIEVRYLFESAYKFNWREWEFQSTIPKVYSEFWARIPGTYVYNITLRGKLALVKNESSVVAACYTPFGHKTDCAQFKYAMKDIPAFREEEYMTSKHNFMSAIKFELAEFKRYDGSRIKYTEEWSDIDRRLQNEEDFGGQIKQARKIWDDSIQKINASASEPLKKAKIIYEKIKHHYVWNEFYGKYAQLGAKKSMQSKKGNIADINLTLIGALQAAGIQADPVLLSTRSNGIPQMIYPVLSEFNYVIVRVTVGTEQFWLDASDPLHPFGFVPERCLNGKVRVMSKVSDWVDLKPKDKDKKVTDLNITVNKNGELGGTLTITHFGYDAFNQRKKYFSYGSKEEYWKAQAKNWSHFEVTNYSCQGVDSLDKSFTEKYELVFLEKADNELLYVSPFLIERWETNPFRSNERNFPVDFGAPLEETTIFKLDYQNLFTLDEQPKNVSAALPNFGGRFTFNVSNMNNGIQMTSSLLLSKSVYSPEEYHFVKELFARVIQTQQSQFVLKRKTN